MALPEPPAGTNGYFLEENGLVKVQFEDIANGSSPPSGWVYQDASNGDNPGFEGDGYYYWKSETSIQLNNQPNQGLISTTVYIQNAGTYNLYLRSARDSNDPSDQRNDIWVKVDGDTIPLLPTNKEMVTADGFVKLYGASTNWGTSKNFDDANTDNNPDSRLVLSEGFHTITFAGRSQGFHIDSFQLNTRGGANNALESSQFITAVETGAATLTITPNEDIQGSNFGSNSFRIENVGDKTIASVEIDVTNALLRDAVFDPFGQAGDTVTKPLTINSAGNTGVVAPSSSSYIGAGGTAGYEKIQLVFNPNSSGGFQPGESVGFAIDMDPNSIAGAEKDPLDAGSEPAWDVGGVNGAELIGSSFTVIFTDGTTATGQLQGVTDSATTNSQGGGRGLATQAPSAGTVSLEVDGLSPGDAGSYAAGGPQVVIDGPAGATARIVLLKGFIQPGDNLFTGAYKTQLDAQLAALAASDFPVNNAVEFQVRDVVLTGNPQDVTALFDFDSVPVPGVTDADSLPLGFVAGLIDPENDDLPAGPVTTPIYLVADDGSEPVNAAPVASDDTAASDGASVTVDVLGNDSDADGDTLTLDSFTQGTNGTVTRDDGGTPGDLSDDQLIYTPGAGFSGQDSFTYTIEDGQGGGDTATVDVTVLEDGPAPAFELYINTGGGAYTALDGTSYVADTYVSGGTAGSKSAAIAGTEDDALFNAYRFGNFDYAIPVANGTYEIDLSFSEFYWTQNGARVFDVEIEGATALDNFDIHAAAGAKNTAFTAPSITVEVTDGVLDIDFRGEVRAPLLQAIGIRSLDAAAPGVAPVAAGDAYTIAEDGTLTVGAAQGVLANDSDADGDALSASVATGPANGTLSLAADGSFVYTPDADFSGSDGFSYTVTDATGRTDEGTVAITVEAADNAAPVASDDTAASDGASVTVDVLGNDSDADGDTLTLDSFTQGTNGTVTRDDGGTPGDLSDDQLIYTPGAGFSGQDSFTYTIEDGQGGGDTATVDVTVLEDGPAPAFELYINTGGGAYTALDGTSYVADTYVSGGTAGSKSAAIAGTEDDALFNAYRFGNFDYAIPVANGTYEIDLSFSEFYWTQNGARVFDVEIEGATALDNFDIHAAAGAKNTAFTAPSITVEVTDGVLDIDFRGEVRAPLLQAIGIRSLDAAAPGVAPVAAGDAYTIAEDGTLTVGAAQGVLANDSDADGDALSASVATGPANGTLSLAADGSFVYTPDADFSGSDGFSYTVTDATGRTDEEIVAITVEAANDDPTAVADTTASDGTAVTVNVLGNDSDADGDTLTLDSFTQGTNGTVTRDDGGTPGDLSDDQLIYTPGAGFSGQDSFTYTIEDGQGGSDTATVTVVENATPLFELNINAGGGAYTSTDGVSYVADSYFIGGSTYSTNSPIAFTDDPILFQTERYGQFGYAIPLADGIYEVTLDFAEIYFDAAGQRVFDVEIEGALPLDDFDIWTASGDINRAYTTAPILVEVTDGTLNIDFLSEVQNPKVSAISVRTAIDAGDPPDAVADAYATGEDAALTVAAAAGVLANDSDADGEALTASLVVGAANGSVTLAADGSFNYVPALNFNGTDSFTYAVRDATGLSSTATVTINVAAVNDPPVAVADEFITSVDTPISIRGANALLENDVDVEGDELSVVAVNGAAANVGTQITLPSGALLTVNSFGRIDYEPAAGFTGEDTFTYTVGDGIDTGSTATVTIDVVSSLPPVAETNTGVTVDEAGTTTISAAMLQTTDPDTSPDKLVYTLTALPVHGALTLGGIVLEAGDSFTQTDIDGGALAYIHDGSETLSDGFGYEVSDGLFTLSDQGFEITVAPVNDAPVAANDGYWVDYETPLGAAAAGVLANDTDVDGPPLAVGAVNGNASAVGNQITLPSGALLTLNADGSFVYEPLAGFSGEDSFAYTVEDGAGGSDIATVDLDIAPAEPPFALHINAGGNAYTAANGTQYVADSFFSGGKKFTNAQPIAGTEDDALFQTERFGTNSFSYNIAVEPGTYAVSLDFAELSFDSAGQRLFDVKIESQTVFDNLDIWAEAGDQFTAYEPSPHVVNVIDGELNIEFVKGVQNPKISAISVVDVTSDDNSPIAQNDSDSVRLSSFVAIDVLENDLDFDGDALQIVSVGGEATKGTVSINDAGTPGDATDDYLVYTSNGNSTGQDTFSYTIADETGKTSTATVTVDVLPLDAVAFERVSVTGIPDKSYTTIQFGPDDRLYASDRFGEIFAFEVEAQLDPVTGKVASYAATSVETIGVIKTIPNHDDDGTLAPEITDRQITGFVVGGSADNPVIYVGSSDPREGGGGGGGDGDLGLDTNSGIISRLTWTGAEWDKVDLVRGLPRSEENHSTNGLLLTTDPDTGHRILLAAQGGNTNSGAPSQNFAYANETALSAAILKIDLTELESGEGDYAVKTDGAHHYVYDLPTVMGDTVGVFGGRDGLNQARLVEGSPVSVHSSGWRNPYDLVETEDGDIFTIDNGANQGWGGLPAGEGTGDVSNQLPTSDPDGFNSVNNLDHLEWVQGPGYYGGHPNPLRANPDGAGIIYTDANGNEVWAQNPGGAWPPVDPSFSFPEDGDFLLPGVDDNALTTWKVSTNGLAEYTSTGFQGAMQGNLLAAAFDSSIYRIIVNGSNSSATKEALASGLPGIPLDVIAQGDSAIFPGTIWIAYVAGGADIEVLVPTLAIGTPDDLDGDGYSNADETANGTNPNSPSSVPPDNDGDFVSDLTDEDDDNDTLLDWVDHFALNPENGTTRVITDAEGFFNPLRNDDPGTGFAGLGFTGWMSDGETDYLDRFDDDNLIAGGTSGIFTIIETTAGDARGALNTQDNGFQFGVVADTAGPMLVQASMLNVFSPLTGELTPGAAAGIHIGNGDQDNYVKLAVGVNAAGELGIVMLHEENGIVLEETFLPEASVPLGADVQLYFEVDADTGSVMPGWKISGQAGQTGDAVTVSGELLAALQGTYENEGIDSALAVGMISTNGGGDPFAAQYDFINVFGGTLADEFALA